MTTILCFGDSNTYGSRPEDGGRYPGDVRWPGIVRRLGAGDWEVIEEGLNGRTTVWDDPFADGLNGRRYLGPCLRSHAPLDIVVLMLGTNDLKAQFRLGAPEIAQGAETLVDLVRASGAGPDGSCPRMLLVAPIHVATATAASSLWGFGAAIEVSRGLAEHYRTVAQLAGCAFLDAAEFAVASPLDGVHLDAEGHRRLGEAIAAMLRTMHPRDARDPRDPGAG